MQSLERTILKTNVQRYKNKHDEYCIPEETQCSHRTCEHWIIKNRNKNSIKEDKFLYSSLFIKIIFTVLYTHSFPSHLDRIR